MNELFRDHLFQLAITFHAGIHVVLAMTHLLKTQNRVFLS